MASEGFENNVLKKYMGLVSLSCRSQVGLPLATSSNGPTIPASVIVQSAGVMITGKGKLKYSKNNLSQRHSVHHKSHMEYPGLNPSPHGKKPVNNCLNYGTART